MARTTACRATKLNGQPCGSVVVLASGFCFLHDPDRQAEVRAVSAKGGRGKARIARASRLVPADIRPTLDLLLTVLRETYVGTVDPKVATACAAVASAICRTYQTGVVEERLAALEQAYRERSA